MIDRIARPWIWAEDLPTRIARLGVYTVFVHVADKLSDDGEHLTVNGLQSAYFYKALEALALGRDDEAALAAIAEHRDEMLEHHLHPTSIPHVKDAADRCIDSMSRAFTVARAGEDALLSGAFDLASFENTSGVVH